MMARSVIFIKFVILAIFFIMNTEKIVLRHGAAARYKKTKLSLVLNMLCSGVLLYENIKIS